MDFGFWEGPVRLLPGNATGRHRSPWRRKWEPDPVQDARTGLNGDLSATKGDPRARPWIPEPLAIGIQV